MSVGWFLYVHSFVIYNYNIYLLQYILDQEEHNEEEGEGEEMNEDQFEDAEN